MPTGLLVLDKPSGITSRDAVDNALRWFPRRTKMGHTGTLDPLATGVLVLCLGTATRLTEYVQRMGKSYRAGIRLGARSDTDDADGTVRPTPDASPIDSPTVATALSGFVGIVEQVPPAHSAAKVAGRRAYDLARRGQEVSLAARSVTISGIDVLHYEWPRLDIEVRCGKGTYIRSLARDLGERLGCGGLIESLRRTRVGPFTVEDAVPLDSDPAVTLARLLPMSLAVADLSRVEVTPSDARRIAQGHSLDLPPGLTGDEAAIFDANGTLIGVAAIDVVQRLLRPTKVLSSV